MATKDKLPTFEQIWGSPQPTVIRASRTAIELIDAEIAKAKRKPADIIDAMPTERRTKIEARAAELIRREKARKPKGKRK